MIFITAKNRSFIVTATLVLIGSVVGSYQLHAAFEAKIKIQQKNNSDLTGFKNQITSLIPVKAEWEKAFPSVSNRDMLSIYRSLEIEKAGLSGHPDTLGSGEITPVDLDKVPLGVSKVCLQNSDTFEVDSQKLSGLLNGLTNLFDEHRLTASKIALDLGADHIEAHIKDFCLIFRG